MIVPHDVEIERYQGCHIEHNHDHKENVATVALRPEVNQFTYNLDIIALKKPASHKAEP